MKAMILAAGRGTRMGCLTKDTPKPLLKVGKYALIEHQLFALAKNGFQEVIINVSYLGQQIITHLGNGERYGLNITYSIENEPGLETGGGIFNALPLLGNDPFLVISADIWTNYSYQQLININGGNLVHLVLVDNPSYHALGDFHLEGSMLSEADGQRLTYSNIGVYHPDLFADCKPGFFRLAPLIREAIKAKKASAEYFNGEWVNVGTPDILAELNVKNFS